ncbi:MAG: hypothetical protein A2174_00635 [Candidatus Portnoybacteria bacterium RBG_13_41_18]|uniref:UMP kinase n=1 Tax=Candidatus Portnoybacteria bacterium RBG_13_41_18 TaxID=1801991 RepID=A0A1G2F4S8_9BACT|nr:MAG: hypothetical protein A2174_00635 [Candidatus Portnoybacteria bacterium RBG_13_41_18]
MSDSKKDFVVALGGSSIYPNEIDVEYLKQFYNFICDRIKKGMRFVIVIGGGALARKFQNAASQVNKVSDEDKDWIGIHATRLNAHLLRTIFFKEADPVIMDSRGKLKDFDSHAIIIGAGWRPGWSTDFVAVQIATDFGLKQTIILGKPEYVFDKDPSFAPPSLKLRRASKAIASKHQKFPEAKPFKNLSWDEYLKLIPNDWSPGIHAPVDPIAAKLAQSQNLEVIVASGADLENFKKILDGGKFKGTVIKNN